RREGRDIAMLVAGDGPAEAELRAAAQAAEVPLHLLGFCNQSRMPSVYAAADILALPSEHETWGLVANEALACGRPVVLSDAVGCGRDLADGLVGRTFTMGSVSSLTDCLAQLLANPPETRLIAAKSAKYSIDAAVRGVIAALES